MDYQLFLEKIQEFSVKLSEELYKDNNLLKEIVKKFPNENYIYLADNLYAPYGNKSKKWLVARLNELIEYLYTNFNVKLVIFACNTASSCIDCISKISPVKVVSLDLNSCAIGEYKILCTKLSAKNYTNTEIGKVNTKISNFTLIVHNLTSTIYLLYNKYYFL